jgi:hypothetical protein
MSAIHISPMPEKYRSIPKHLRPCVPPLFMDGEPTDSDRELARELFLILDADSQDWYRRSCSALFAGL